MTSPEKCSPVLSLVLSPLTPKVEYWTVQNTGWSAGVSWFDSGGSRYSPARFESESQARDYIERNRGTDPDIRWRFTHVVIERQGNKRITTEEWQEVTD